jgi:apolipoprotein N-acyltransferase
MWLPIISAALGVLAFLPINFYSVGFVFLVPLFLFFLQEQKFWRLVLGALLFRFIFGLGTVYFTLEPILWSSSLLIFTGLPISVWLIKKIRSAPRSSNFVLFVLLFSLPLLWTFFDIMEAHYSLVPIYIVAAGNSLGSSPFGGLAGFGGMPLLTFFAALINVLLAAVIYFFISTPKENFDRKFKYKLAAIGFVMIVLLISTQQLSQFKLRQNNLSYKKLPGSIKIAAVSINAKFNINPSLCEFDELKKELTAKPIDLIILPEYILNEFNLLNFFPDQPSLLKSKTAFLIQNMAKELKMNLLATFDTFQNEAKYNSAVLFSNQGNIVQIHNKRRLTFAGEYWPFNWQPPLARWIKQADPQALSYAIFDPKNNYWRGDKKILSVNLQKQAVSFAAPICLEAHYPTDLKEYKKMGARFIVNPTSNRWIKIGASHFSYLNNNLRRVNAIWLNMPIISSGVKESVGIILPNGQVQLIGYENGDKNYKIFSGEIRY